MLIAAELCSSIIFGKMSAELDEAVANPVDSPQPSAEMLVAAIQTGNRIYDRMGISSLLYVPKALRVLPIATGTPLQIARHGDLTIVGDGDQEKKLDQLFEDSSTNWQASVLLSTPYAVMLRTRASPRAAVLFDSHKPLVSLASEYVSTEMSSLFLSHLFEHHLSS